MFKIIAFTLEIDIRFLKNIFYSINSFCRLSCKNMRCVKKYQD